VCVVVILYPVRHEHIIAGIAGLCKCYVTGLGDSGDVDTAPGEVNMVTSLDGVVFCVGSPGLSIVKLVMAPSVRDDATLSVKNNGASGVMLKSTSSRIITGKAKYVFLVADRNPLVYFSGSGSSLPTLIIRTLLVSVSVTVIITGGISLLIVVIMIVLSIKGFKNCTKVPTLNHKLVLEISSNDGESVGVIILKADDNIFNPVLHR
jgi:hypothetical protein